MSHRVVYGETMPTWERILQDEREARAFARQRRKCGDLVFSITEVRPDDPPRSIMAAIEAASAGAYE